MRCLFILIKLLFKLLSSSRKSAYQRRLYYAFVSCLFTMLKLSEWKVRSLPLLQDYNKQEQLTEVIYRSFCWFTWSWEDQVSLKLVSLTRKLYCLSTLKVSLAFDTNKKRFLRYWTNFRPIITAFNYKQLNVFADTKRNEL